MVRSFKTKNYHSTKVSQRRSLTAQKSHSKEVAQQRSLTTVSLLHLQPAVFAGSHAHNFAFSNLTCGHCRNPRGKASFSQFQLSVFEGCLARTAFLRDSGSSKSHVLNTKRASEDGWVRSAEQPVQKFHCISFGYPYIFLFVLVDWKFGVEGCK